MSSALRPADTAAAIDAAVAPAATGRASVHTDNWGAAALVVLFCALLALPIAAAWLHWHLIAAPDEKRSLAKAPHWPHDFRELLALPGRLSHLADDRFGFRNELVWLNGSLRYRLFGEVESDQVLFGRHGRLFLTSHVRGRPFSLVDAVCGIGDAPATTRAMAGSIAHLLRDAGRLAPISAYIAIPTAPVLYPEDLPPWLAARCRSARPSAPAVRDALASGWPELAGRLVDPLDAMLAAKAAGYAIPLTNFHWGAAAAKAVVEAVAERSLGLAKRRDIGVRDVIAESDLAGFIPGITLRNPATVADFAGSGIEQCGGASCFPELASFAPVLREVSHFWWESGHGPTLLLISDSFGALAAEYFAEYFADVIHVNIAYERLSVEQRQRLREVLFARFKPDAMVVLFHDAGVRSAATLVDTALLQP